jgi:hypothetical protein
MNRTQVRSFALIPSARQASHKHGAWLFGWAYAAQLKSKLTLTKHMLSAPSHTNAY